MSPLLVPMDRIAAERVLKEAKRILDGRGLVFFLRHGTCLGAVRDRALIEWDDDLDIGSVIGLHGLTEGLVRRAVNVFRARGFDANIEAGPLHLSVALWKAGIRIDWTCYRIVEDGIYQWPAVRIPVNLHTDLQEIEFLGETCLVPNPPETYLRLKYGPEWMIPRRPGRFEQDVLNLVAEEQDSWSSDGILGRKGETDPRVPSGILTVLDLEGCPVEGAEVSLACSTVRTGRARSRTDRDGRVFLYLPASAGCAVTVQYGDHMEVLYQEHLSLGVEYVYRPHPEHQAGRTNALIPQSDALSSAAPEATPAVAAGAGPGCPTST